MRSSTETYHEVAERCSAYEKTCHCNSMTNKQKGSPLTGQPEKTWKISLFRLFSGAYVLFIIDTYSTS